MSLATIDSAFSQPVLTEAVRLFATQSTDGYFRRLFSEGRTKPQQPGTVAKWDEVRYSRGLAPITGLLSPSPIGKPLEIRPKESEMMRVAESRFIPWTKLFIDRHAGELKDNAREVVMDELADCYLEIGKTLELAHASVLRSGGFAPTSTIIPGTDYPFTLDFTVKTANKANAWSSAATAIISDEIPKFQATEIQNCGLAIDRAIINDVTLRYILANTEVSSYFKNWANAQVLIEQGLIDTQVFQGIELGGITFDVNPFGYIPDGGSFTGWMPQDKAIFLPEDLSPVLATAEGRQALPNTEIIGRADGPLPELMYGMIAWAEWTRNPVGITLHVSWYGLPLVTFPDAVLYATLV